jgi:hypothetical protein
MRSCSLFWAAFMMAAILSAILSKSASSGTVKSTNDVPAASLKIVRQWSFIVGIGLDTIRLGTAVNKVWTVSSAIGHISLVSAADGCTPSYELPT